ncbi:hypothetical protein [Hymenobacter negativus]|uniref:Uncharacterized protein n=1 Tax=Hymenobacter negativus TaxID=2795026 RepID=A0ABS3QA83_9BACT|nr:hypothetical protein [Hymenobacter negativus]MBO2008164.1 hypothetical protein [Hymenobacter negativus]
MSLLLTVSSVLLDGYILCVAMLLSGLMLLPRHRKSNRHLLAQANTLLLFGALLLILLMAWEIFQLVPFKNEWDWFAFANRITGPYWFLFWAIVVWKVLLPQLFWRKRLRHSIALTAVIVAGLAFTLYAPILPFLFRDYLPSSWGIEPSYLSLLAYAGGFLIILRAMRWFRKRQNLAANRG